MFKFVFQIMKSIEAKFEGEVDNFDSWSVSERKKCPAIPWGCKGNSKPIKITHSSYSCANLGQFLNKTAISGTFNFTRCRWKGWLVLPFVAKFINLNVGGFFSSLEPSSVEVTLFPIVKKFR